MNRSIKQLPVVALLGGITLFAACTAPQPTETKNASPSASVASEASAPAPIKIVRLDPAFDQLIAPDAKVEKLATGYKWTEGPVWNKKEGYLLFSDIPNNRIIKYKDGVGASEYIKPAGYTGSAAFTGDEPGTNGLVYDAQGRLTACAHGDRMIVRLEDDGKKRTTVIDKVDGKRFNSPNDLVFKSNGDLYFTDPIYGLPGKDKDPGRETDYCGVYRLAKNGQVTLLTKEITRPNGIGFSPDEKTLYVACSDPDKALWMAYEVKPDGSLGAGKVFNDMTAAVKAKKPGLPDGLKVDKSGNIWATGPGGVHVFAPDGKLLGTIDTGVPTANVGFGDDGSTLYITANTELLRVKTLTKGQGF